MDKQQKIHLEKSSLLDEIFPLEAALASVTKSKSLCFMIIIGCLSFGAMALYLLKRLIMQ